MNERLTAQVGEHYADFVAGMALVGEVDSELQMAHVVARNGRRFLASAADEVERNLRVAGNTRQKARRSPRRLLDRACSLSCLRSFLLLSCRPCCSTRRACRLDSAD